ncbi:MULTISPECIES: thiamine pyrophosphate-binding protein [Mycolicibacterium]|uniref:acetolactate synthase n=1 Tax=Mycolicibacterium senegalense TaxID=1796 RepID=A0A378W473_9MYCO|nr:MULTISPECIES: thiamine pyrophosphate-binding protein [Mycolicibacterium]MCV7335753.1 thiamine pyrophosphate-binding protein [Mycolicibacterium senegalense]MDR7288818.1 acetolactate synthase-1/2/3 large subunit [Mycolicibacterium senegalense]QZA25724.1 thiamine pyrophosphate-binding protein [Mycolicibacterium senegalense]CDP84999.1 acetolactate synthase [Mycolicibacterium farcinogenes]SUA27609.1 acetolactate synthase [Mycolicibacterium senegalense]
MVEVNRVVDHIVGYLAATGITHIFGVDGANIEDLYDAAHFRDDITAVLAKHEFSAATMADGYSRSGGGVGVVAATSGGGCLNTVPGLAESLASRVPVLALIGQAPTTLDGRGAFQDTSGDNGSLDGHALFSAVSLYCRRLRKPADILTALPQALAAARSGGPAVLLLPKDIQQADVGEPAAGNGRAGAAGKTARHADLRVLERALRGVDGPVTIIAGEQVARDDARAELERLRAVLRARVATVPDAKDVAGTPGLGSSSALGVAGVMGHPGVPAAAAQSALCLLVGTRMTVTARAGLDTALASVPTYSIGAQSPYPPCTHAHSDDLRASLTALARALSGPGRPAQVRVPDTAPRTELRPPAYDGPGIRYRDAMCVLDDALPDGTDIVVDAGNVGASAIHYLPVRRDGRFLVALGMGGMGYSFGAGIGMTFHRASAGAARRTAVIAGDGSFFMHGMEIHTAMQYRLPITFVLFDNHAHAMCVTREQLFYEGRYSYNRFGPSRLGAGLAAMFPGLPAYDVAEIRQLPQALGMALDADGPSVLSIECSADEIPPFAAFLTTTVSTPSMSEENSPHVTTRA